MSDNYDSDVIISMSVLEHIRFRPGLYLGSTGFWGHIHLLVGVVAECLLRDARTILFEVRPEGGFVVSSDAKFAKRDLEPVRASGLAVAAALAETCTLRFRIDGTTREWRFKKGERQQDDPAPTALEAGVNARIEFEADLNVLEPCAISGENIHSYFRRLSFLQPQVKFRVMDEAGTVDYYSERGLPDLFHAISAPYQIHHQPAHVTGEEDGLRLELIWAFHSWKNDVVVSFANKGRVVDGGTHEQGLNRALDHFRTVHNTSNGIVALLAIEHSAMIYEGCIKKEIGNTKFVKLVSRMAIGLSQAWFEAHPEEAASMAKLSLFSFPSIWWHLRDLSD